ncbi:MAG: NYN domain-containing protein [Hyphomicrobiales bacterium]|nr:NYN domain-containing protein [Hyphomicrobiales bacterium]
MTPKPRVALFIDAENASAKYVTDYLRRCGDLGKLTIARCYGGAASLKKWDKAMKDHHIVPMQTPPGASKENASDFALTIDAVSLLHRGLFDHAVIASSDADFMQLAIHIREHGKGIDGLGESKATKPLQSAFDIFTIIPAAAPKRAPAPKPSPAPAPARKLAARPAIDRDMLMDIYRKLSANGKAVTPRVFGTELSVKMPNYKKGHRTLENFLRNSGVFRIENGVIRPFD